MDESVRKAMEQWPNVPDCYGWLRLDRRGNWYLKNEPVEHRGLMDFINRNYLQSDSGSYVFQNGPQRVHVELAYTPYVLRLPQPDSQDLMSHTGLAVESIQSAWIDENGSLILLTNFGCGWVDDRDMQRLSDCFYLGNEPADDDQLISAFESVMSGTEVDELSFVYRGSTTPVLPVRSSDLERVAGFVTQPVEKASP